MKKRNILLLFIAMIVMMTACSPGGGNVISTPSWLQDDWYTNGSGDSVHLSITRDNIQIYVNGQLQEDIKSSLALNPHVEISSQASTDNSYQIDLYNTIQKSTMRISILYTESNNSILYKEIYDGITGNNFVLYR